ncbi:MAG: hypothetical protein U1E39_00330 [Planctomycetota bacterium]
MRLVAPALALVTLFGGCCRSRPCCPPAQQDVIRAQSPYGGLFVSNDGGRTWAATPGWTWDDIDLNARAGSPPQTSAEPAQGSDVAGWIEVTALRADGKPASGAIAYAVRVGRVSETTMPDWPQAEIDANGAARIPVPTVAKYDVGVVFPGKEEPRALLLDVPVAAGGTSRVEVRLPALASVTVDVAGVDPARARVYAEEEGEPKARPSYYPARGEPNDERWSLAIHSGNVELPKGVPYRLWLEVEGEEKSGHWLGAGWLADPAVVRAPGRVTFRRDPAPEPLIEVPIRFTVTGSVPPGLRRSDMVTRYAEGTPDEMNLDGTLEWKDGSPQAGSLTIVPAAKPAKLRWRGDGIAPGEVTLPGATGEPTAAPPIDIAVRADDLPFLDGVDVECARKPPRTDSPFLHVTGPTAGRADDFGFYIEHENRLEDVRPGSRVIAEWGAWWVSRPIEVPSRGRLKLTLVPGGYLLATSPRVPTPGLGTLTIRRADGAWLGERDAHDIESDDCDGESASIARPGMILGPFAEGDVELVVSLGGEERARIIGHVKANAITPFPLTW